MQVQLSFAVQQRPRRYCNALLGRFLPRLGPGSDTRPLFLPYKSGSVAGAGAVQVMAEATDVETALGSGRLRASWDYWQSKLAGRSMPTRADLDPPLEIPRLLPWIILTDVLLRDPLDFRYRLIGTAIRDRIAGNYTGMRLMELPHQRPGSRIWDTRAECVRTMAPE